MRLGLCGAHGAGKTTLAQAVCKVMGIDIVQSPSSTYWEMLDISDISTISQNYRWNDQNVIFGMMAQQIASNQNNIFERTPLDVLMYTTFFQQQNAWWYDRVYRLMKLFDYIVYVPYEANRVGGTREEQEKYKEKVSTALEYDSIMKELIWDYSKVVLDEQCIIKVSGSVEDRLKQILNTLNSASTI